MLTTIIFDRQNGHEKLKILISLQEFDEDEIQFVKINFEDLCSMGPIASEPLYCLYPLESFQKSDCLPVKYLWLDKNIDNYQNKAYFQKFSRIFSMAKFKDNESLQQDARQVDLTKCRVRVLISASFQDQVYDWLQSNESIERIALFCGNKTKAGILMRNFPKIKSACFGFEEVIRAFKIWEREEVRNIYFFEEKDMELLYLTTINWHSLTDIDETITPNIKETFFKFCSDVLKDNSPLDSKNPSNSKIVDSASLVTYVIENSLFLAEINSFLRQTRDPTKLAYIRWPVHHLFKFIKERYSEQKTKGQITLYGVITLNSQQKRQLSPGSVINIVQFIMATQQQPDRRSCQTMIEIKVGPNQPICNGYYTVANGALFNIGNFYRITKKYDENDCKLSVELMAFSKEHKIQRGNIESQVLLNQLRINSMEVLKEGQWYSLILSGRKTLADEYLGRMDRLHKKMADSLENVKWLLARQKVKVRMGFPLDEAMKKLEQLMRINNDNIQKIVLTLTTLSQMTLSSRNPSKFEVYFLELCNLLDSPKTSKILREPLFNSKIELMKIMQTLLRQKSNNYNWKEAAKEIQKFQMSLIVMDNHRMASGLYLFCLEMKAFCFELLEDFKSELEVLDLIIWILSSVLSHDNYWLKKFLMLKKETFEKIYPKESKEEAEIQRKMMNSKISIEDLLSRNSLLNVDVSGLEIFQNPE